MRKYKLGIKAFIISGIFFFIPNILWYWTGLSYASGHSQIILMSLIGGIIYGISVEIINKTSNK